jgi:hypothetical protein
LVKVYTYEPDPNFPYVSTGEKLVRVVSEPEDRVGHQRLDLSMPAAREVAEKLTAIAGGPPLENRERERMAYVLDFVEWLDRCCRRIEADADRDPPPDHARDIICAGFSAQLEYLGLGERGCVALWKDQRSGKHVCRVDLERCVGKAQREATNGYVRAPWRVV